MNTFPTDEKHLSQIPALQLLINLGYEYLSPEQAFRERNHKKSNVLLENILRDQLKKINRIRYRGTEHLFSEENIQSAIQKLRNIKYDGLQRTNETLYDLLTLGTAQEQSIEGDSRSYNLNYIDWRNNNNRFHVTAEFDVERNRSSETARPDIVLFVNGIPFAIIECKSPQTLIEQAVSQSIRNQSDDFIPKLFVYAQMVVGLNKNAARYATVGSAAKFWSVWKELRDTEEAVTETVNRPLTPDQKQRLFSGVFAPTRRHFDALEAEGSRIVTEQDRTLFSLCRPERLLELAHKFTVFDGGIKKIARYQQYFVIKSTIERVKQYDDEGRRKGGIIWHTQGSGKSLSMVMLTRNLAFDPEIKDPRIVLVTDRDDLDKQLGNTFAACGLEPVRATSGRSLLDLVFEKKSAIITTLIHKFDKALNAKKTTSESSDIFVLVDESHRTNFGGLSARMRQMFPKACYIGFTGTPLMKKEKNNFLTFGGLIDPHYSINQAVEDEAVVPLLYEGRHVEIKQNKAAIDLWFDRHTQNLTAEQKADLKKKYARAEMLNKADRVVYMRAFDISEHFRANWQGTGFKGQLVAPNKATALKYNEYLAEIGTVSSEVVISAPDAREGYDEVDDEPTDEVVKFWQKMMKRYGGEEEYLKQIINQFKFGDEPEILIVVSKLLTGFDAPRNVVMYLCKELKEHTLLQAIARVNRLYENKEFGFIVDYAGSLGALDKALTMYAEFEGFDEDDLAGTLTSVQDEIKRLPQRHADLWDVFKEVKSRDEEAYEELLFDDARRNEFYKRLAEYSKALFLALSTHQFVAETEEKKVQNYKADLKRFHNLKASVKMRYQDAIDYRDYEPKIKKLLDTHLQADEVIQLHKPFNIHDAANFSMVREPQPSYGESRSLAAQADTIASAMKREITEKMDEDPAFYEKFSKLIQQAIDNFRAKRITDLDYIGTVKDLRNRFIAKQHDDMPEDLRDDDEAMAYYGVMKPFFDGRGIEESRGREYASLVALAVKNIFSKRWKVHFWEDEDAQKKAINDIDDHLYDVVGKRWGVSFEPERMDEIITTILRVARRRRT